MRIIYAIALLCSPITAYWFWYEENVSTLRFFALFWLVGATLDWLAGVVGEERP